MTKIDDIFRSTATNILNQRTREGIEDEVCRSLATVESYSSVWIGSFDADTKNANIEIRESAKTGSEDRIRLSEKTIETISNLLEDKEVRVANDGQKELALVPILSEEIPYGVLAIRSEDGIDNEELEMLEELGTLVGFRINAVEVRESLLSGRSIRLKFQVSDSRLFSIAISQRSASQVSIESMLPRSDGTFLQILRIDGVPEKELREVADEHSPQLEQFEKLFVDEESGDKWAVITSTPCIAAPISEFGGKLKSATAESGVGKVITELPPEADVAELMERLESEYTAVQITAKRDESRQMVSDRGAGQNETTGVETATARSHLVERLTTRQREVLETAYLSGFFEMPRRKSSVEVAEMLGISQPTFSEHIRDIEKEVFSTILEE